MINKMKKTATLTIATLLIVSMASIILTPTVSAHTPAWQIPTYAYVNVSPNPVGVGQTTAVVMWLDKVIDGANVKNNIRFHNYNLTITAPDGTTETKIWDVVTDTTSSQYYGFTPDQTGTYTLTFNFPGQTFDFTDLVQSRLFGPFDTTSAYRNDTYLASTATTTLTVQEDAVDITQKSTSLPTEYWSRPINGQNSNWYTISSNWLGGFGSTITYNVQPDGTAPETSHVMWTKELQIGGVIGGTNIHDGSTYYAGESYEEKFYNPLIIDGCLYYTLGAASFGGAPSGTYVCVDLQTGQQLWSQNYPIAPSFGCILNFNSGNQHGGIPYLIATSGTTWIFYSPLDGSNLFNITNVPSGTRAYGENGEILSYSISGGQLLEWNLTQCITNGAANALDAFGYRPIGLTLNSAQRDSYSKNITLPSTIPAGSSIVRVLPGDLILGSTSLTPAVGVGTNAYTAWAISLNADNYGDKLWSKSYDAPSNNVTRSFAVVDTVNRVFTMLDKETMQWSGFDLDNGNLLWGPVGDETAYQYYSSSVTSYNAGGYSTAYGNLYHTGFGGLLYCYDTATGELLWTYGNGGEGNSTYDASTVWGYRPMFISNIADGKIYLFNNEHSSDSPMYKNAEIRCLNATTGQELWKTLSWASSTSFYSQAGVIADGYLAYFNTYDGQVYSLGRGASKTTIEGPMTAVTAGDSMVIQGTVTDISSGTTQEEQTARFPNGIACVSDDSMSNWMKYIYMQQDRPNNATGVPVLIGAVDPNGNYVTLGTATSDTSGLYGLTWQTPNVPGKYTIIASFAGTNGYYGSYSETTVAVSGAPEATPEPTAQPQSTADLYFVPAVIGIIVAIAIVGAVIILVLKKKP